MRVTNLLKVIVLSLFIVLTLPATTNAMHVNSDISALPADSIAETKAVTKIVQRVYEIQSMDKSNLSTSEKKALRKELKNLKKEAQEKSSGSNGIYLSIGAVIVIILLLILLLK
jgi:predicted PurR-regulated permease PerM